MDISPTGAALNSTGLVFKLYGEHFGTGTVPLAVTGNSPQRAPKYNAGYDHPQVNAGSATWPLDVVAALAPDKRTLRIGIVNATLEPRKIAIKTKHLKITGRGSAWLLTGDSLDAENKAGAPPKVTIRELPAATLSGGLAVPTKSVAVFEFPVATSR
jgi:alpha-N-arabinofuranosidase